VNFIVGKSNELANELLKDREGVITVSGGRQCSVSC